jgi:hypothetical protein
MRLLSALALSLTAALAGVLNAADEGFVSLFDGKSLDGWKVNENPTSVKVEDGCLVVHGERAHVFYAGPVANHDFKNFHFKAEVMTAPGANSGIYFHTAFQDSGWPAKGYESQVNNTQKDPKKTGGLYAVKDVFEAPARDDTWFLYEIIVDGRHVVIRIDGKVTTDYTEPEGEKRPDAFKGRLLSSGTFALQCHDPGSKVKYRNIQVKLLP